MNSPRRALAALLMLAAPASAADPAGDYAARAKPLVQKHCGRCHDEAAREGGVTLTAFADAAAALARPRLWKRSADRLAAGEMPPADAPQPTPAEKAELLHWMRSAAEFVDCDPARRDPGPSAARRLTRTEYENTVRDLLGVRVEGESVGMPGDPAGDHFDNLAAALPLSDALTEAYFAAADRAAEAARGHFPGPGAKASGRAAAEADLARLVRRAYRRPPAPADVARVMAFYDRARAGGAGHDDALRACLKPVLVSPRFLLRVEEDRPAAGPGPGVPVDAHELAVRLSYFLWSTMPDEALFRAAEDGTLARPGGLDAQARRMLADPKARALSDGFFAQWLQLRKFAKARPTSEFFPAFTADLRKSMAAEASAFVEHLRAQDRPVLELLDADYTFADERLARFYGVAGVSGPQVRKVALRPEHHRGGLLGMGAVLAMTSHTFRTSPTQRGKYVLDVIFGTPPPPPPANAPPLKEEAKGAKAEAVSFRDKLAQHATQGACAACHRKIDPLGFALDNYDAVGAWRAGPGLDTSGVLPTGEKLTGAADLKRVILARKDEFARNFAAELLEYALGRELDGADECIVRDVLAAMKANGYRLSSAVAGVVASVPFRQRRAAGK